LERIKKLINMVTLLILLLRGIFLEHQICTDIQSFKFVVFLFLKSFKFAHVGICTHELTVSVYPNLFWMSVHSSSPSACNAFTISMSSSGHSQYKISSMSSSL
jgi:hypothetical protein